MTNQPITHSVICLHGLGSSGRNMVSLARELNLPPGVRFVFPDAPPRPVTCNQGYVMPAWYDIEHFDFTKRYICDEAGIDASCQRVKALIADEQAHYGISPENIFLMGFSQGGSIALELGLHDTSTFAGIIGLSTLPAKALKTFENVSEHSRKIPIFLAHGTQDDILPFSMAEGMASHLTQLNCPLTWHSYAMGHEICTQELHDLRQWFLSLQRFFHR